MKNNIKYHKNLLLAKALFWAVVGLLMCVIQGITSYNWYKELDDKYFLNGTFLFLSIGLALLFFITYLLGRFKKD